MTAVSLVRAELTKIYTLRSGWIALGVILALHVLISLQTARMYGDAVAAITPAGTIEIFVGQPEPATRAILDFLAGGSLQIAIFLSVLAAVLAGQEFRGGQLGAGFLVVPRRGRLVAAKVAALTVHLTGVALVILGMSIAFTYLAVRDWNPGLLTSAAAVGGYGRFVLFAVLWGLTGAAITLAARSILVGAVTGLMLLSLSMAQVLRRIDPAVEALFPIEAGRNLLLHPALGDLTAGPGHAVAVLVGWAAVTTAVAAVGLRRRDAR